MSRQTVSVEEAEKRLGELIGLAQQGDEIIIASGDQAKVRLVPVSAKTGKRIFGQHRGRLHMREDFDDPLPEYFWLGSPA